MKTILDKETRDALIARINSLPETSTAAWGTMNVYQMVKHTALADEMYLGKKKFKRSFLGRLLGKMILKKMLADDTPMKQNAPTSDEFKVQETTGDFQEAKDAWITLVREYEHFSTPIVTHWFFGDMTREQIGQMTYKHTDHHLRQFNG
jgi:hypothetical protein